MLFWHIFTEKFQRIDASGRFLYLVKDNKRFAGGDILSCIGHYITDNTLGLQVGHEQGLCKWFICTIYIYHVLEFVSSELF